MIYLLMAIVLAISGSCLKESSRAQLHSQSLRVILNPFNPSGIPVRINAATAENSVVSCWIEYSVTNLSGEEIDAIYLRVFIADSEGRLIRVRNSFSGEDIAAGATQNDRADIKGNIKQQTIAFMAVSKVITKSGVWQVRDAELEAAIKAKLRNQTDLTPSVSFELNAVTTDVDRSELFELILGDILRDEKKAERLKNQSRVIVLRESVNFDLPNLPSTELTALDQKEIQEIADKEQRVFFLIYEPLTSEGSRVFASIAVRDTVARRPGLYVPYKFTFLFTCVKENGRWIIEKSVGFAQS